MFLSLSTAFLAEFDKKVDYFYRYYLKKNIFVERTTGYMRYKYIYDKDNLVYTKQKVTFSDIVKRNYWKAIAGACVGVLFWIFSFTSIIESPKRLLLETKSQVLIHKLGAVNSQFDSISNQLSLIQHRDDNLYRVVSQLNPISSAERQMGFGGVNSYQSLEGYASSDLLIESMKRSDILKHKLHLQKSSFDNVIQSVLKKHDSLLAVPAISPVSPYDYHRISSAFGIRVHPISGKVQKHDGLDFAARVGKPIYATGNGVVIYTKKSNKGYGNRIAIDHGFGYKTLYAHLNHMNVEKGDTILRGTQIGTVGNTGTSTGPHLHYEVIHNNRKFNPGNYYVNDLSAEEFDSMIDHLSAKN